MTAKQFNAALDKLGFTQMGLARKLELGERSVRRWAAGQLRRCPRLGTGIFGTSGRLRECP